MNLTRPYSEVQGGRGYMATSRATQVTVTRRRRHGSSGQRPSGGTVLREPSRSRMTSWAGKVWSTAGVARPTMALVRRQAPQDDREPHATAVTRHSAPRSRREVRAQRRPRQHGCWGHLIAAPLWPQHGLNLGTLLRSCDATGACLAVPPWRWVDEALARGDTLPRGARPCVHRVNAPVEWLQAQAQSGASVLGVELLDGAVSLGRLDAARVRTVVVLGNEGSGIPAEAIDCLTGAVEIPMIGVGGSLNVAVAGTLVLYRLAGLA